MNPCKEESTFLITRKFLAKFLPEWVKQAHELGMIVNVWTVNKEEMMQQMIDLGVDYITTDKPELCLKLIQQK